MKTRFDLSLALLLAIVLQNGCLLPAAAHLQQTANSKQTFSLFSSYFERFAQVLRTVSQERELDETVRSAQTVARELYFLSPEVLRDAALETITSLSQDERASSSVRIGTGNLQNVPQETPIQASPFDNFNVSEVCLQHLAATVVGMFEKKTLANLWTLQMLDAMGKPPPGMLEGGAMWLGSYDQCGKIRGYARNASQTFFSGRYATVVLYITPTTLFPVNSVSIGLCVPDTCNDWDMTILLNDILFSLGRTAGISVYSLPKEESLDSKAIVAVVICGILLVCMVLGTALDMLYVQMPKRSQEPLQSDTVSRSTNANSVEVNETTLLIGEKSAVAKAKIPEIGICTKLLVSFSVYTNGSKLLSTVQPAGSLTCVHGIRFISMTWVVLGHSYFMSSYYSGVHTLLVSSGTSTCVVFTSYPINYSLALLYEAQWLFGYRESSLLTGNAGIFYPDHISRWSFQTISNATVAVDTFFVLSGLLVAYLSLKEMKKKKGWRINWFLFYFHRFWRLTPAYMLIIMVYTCLYPYWGEGPIWAARENADRKNCETNWWTNLLYVNNVVKTDEMCLGQSWYLANDMQFYILSPLIFVPFYYSPLLGCVASGVFLLATSIAPGVIEMHKHYAPASFVQLQGNYTSDENQTTEFYMKPWNKMGPYVIGLMAGYLLYRTDCKLRINKFVNLLLWAVAAGSAMGVLYGLYDACNGHPITLEVAALYMAVHRQVWGASVAWVVVACVTGNGGFVNTLLSWSGLIPLSRLTYCIYLLHMLMIDEFFMNQRTMFYMNDVNVVTLFLAALVASYGASFVASLAFEAPMMALEKIVFPRGDKNQNKRDDIRNGSEKDKSRGKNQLPT